MKFEFRPLKLPPVPQPNSETRFPGETGFLDPNIAPPELPPGVPRYRATIPRSLDEILADIEVGNADDVTILEWVYLFYAKADWDRKQNEQQQGDRVRSTSQAIWQFAQYNQVIKSRLFWRLALFYNSKGQDKQVLPPYLAKAFTEFVSSFKESDYLTVDILTALASNQGDRKIAELSFKHLLTPKSLLQGNLPESIYGMDETFILIAENFIAERNQQKEQAKLLIDSLNEMSRETQLPGVEYLLTHVPKEIAGQFPILVNWVQKHYGITSIDTRWSELSPEAKAALQDWLGALSYGYFVKLVKILLDKLNLPDWERNQLRSRRDFWSNYSDRFERIRILLPQFSQEAIEEAIGSEFEHQDITILESDGSEPTEVCIFDLGDCCIVEFFRGPGSETRVFNAQDYPDIKTKLFDSSILSLKRLRCLGGEVHDHKYLWQGYCEKLLRNRDIYPNEGTKFFKGLFMFVKNSFCK